MNLSCAIRKVREDYVFAGKAKSFFQINNGLCEDFAADVIILMGGYTEGFQELCNENFMVGEDGDPCENDMWDWPLLEKYWAIQSPAGLKAVDMENIDFGGHTWITHGHRHYDAECPEGVESFFDLPLFRRYIVVSLREQGFFADEVETDDVLPAPLCPVPQPKPQEKKEIVSMSQYELTLRGFDGGTDETDDLVLWVASDLNEDDFQKWLDALELKNSAGDNLIGNVYVLDLDHLTVDDGLDFRLPEQAEEFVCHVREKCEEANNPVILQIKEAREGIDATGEILGEVESQYKSECAAYGDAGPGQWDHVCRLRENLATQEAELAKLMETPEGIALKAKENAEREKRWASGPSPF
jgi:hypothetical protein